MFKDFVSIGPEGKANALKIAMAVPSRALISLRAPSNSKFALGFLSASSSAVAMSKLSILVFIGEKELLSCIKQITPIF